MLRFPGSNDGRTFLTDRRHAGGCDDGAALVHSTLKFPVVGIGASAGGLSALQRFFEQMSAASSMSFLVVLHLSPRHAGHAAGVLRNVTRASVTQAPPSPCR